MSTSDGGVARLRIFGEAKPNWAAVSDKKVSHKRNKYKTKTNYRIFVYYCEILLFCNALTFADNFTELSHRFKCKINSSRKCLFNRNP